MVSAPPSPTLLWTASIFRITSSVPTIPNFTPNQLFLSQTGEFSINTQNGDPSVGGGASAVSIVSPRGTNNWHGQGLSGITLANKWTANPWFNNAVGVPNAALNQNQYGGQVGGPVIKNKLFISGSFEEQKASATRFRMRPFSRLPLRRAERFSYVTSCNNVQRSPVQPASIQGRWCQPTC